MAEEIRSKAAAAAEALYRLSDVPAFDTALKFELRKTSLEILSRAAAFRMPRGERRTGGAAELHALVLSVQELIRFSRDRGWIAPHHAERVLAAYHRIAERLTGFIGSAGAERPRPIPAAPGRVHRAPLSERQRRILAYVASNGRTRSSDVKQLFGNQWNEKTLRRDLQQLASTGLIGRQGGNRWTTYISLGH